MSCQRGNVNRTRAQKHQNGKVFKNDLHDTNIRTKRINQVQIVDVCAKCKAILEWKIKYKKYKLMTVPRKCNKCNEKSVKQSYHTLCNKCSQYWNICPKCECPMDKSMETEQKSPTAIQVGKFVNSSDSESDDNGNDNDICLNEMTNMPSKIIINSH